jgi:hypothetical protein
VKKFKKNISLKNKGLEQRNSNVNAIFSSGTLHKQEAGPKFSLSLDPWNP